MRAMAAMLTLAAASWAANTVVTETRVVAGDGSPAQGFLTIEPVSPFTAADGARVAGVREVPVINGRFAVALEPNLAGTAYRVHWQLDDARPVDGYWVVPASGPVAVCAVEATRVSGSWVVAGCPGDHMTWPSITSTQWSGLTSAQWTTLTGGTGGQSWGGLTSSAWAALTSGVWGGVTQ